MSVVLCVYVPSVLAVAVSLDLSLCHFVHARSAHKQEVEALALLLRGGSMSFACCECCTLFLSGQLP